MKAFMQNEIKNALKRLQAAMIFALKCTFIALVNSLILVLPIIVSIWLVIRSLAGWFEVDQSQGATGKNYTAAHDMRPAPSISERVRAFNSDLQSWIAVIRRYKK